MEFVVKTSETLPKNKIASGARLWSYYRSHVPHNCETAVSSSTREITTTISHSLLRHLFEMFVAPLFSHGGPSSMEFVVKTK